LNPRRSLDTTRRSQTGDAAGHPNVTRIQDNSAYLRVLRALCDSRFVQ
jgi:hypothetical protein